MGGEFDSRTYEGCFTKKEVEQKFKEDVAEAILDYGRRGYTGTIAEHSSHKIKWVEKMVANEDRAKGVIMETQKSKWSDPVAVFFESVEGSGCVVGGYCSS